MPERDPRIVEEFKRRRKRQIIVSVPLVALLLLVLIAKDQGIQVMPGVSRDAFGMGFLVVVLGILVFSFRNWRCPACDRYLGKAWNPSFCSGCGVPLQ